MASTPTDNPVPGNQITKPYAVETQVPEVVSNKESPSTEVFDEGISSSLRMKRVALVGIYAALILVLDYLPFRPPNVEFMTSLLFIAGYCFGARVGGLTALVVSATFSYLNPLGPSEPPLFAFQVAFYVGIALVGSFFARFRQRRPFNVSGRGSMARGALGLLGTLVFDIGSTFAFSLPLTNWNWAAVWPIWLSGIVFTLLHLVSNAIIFAFLLPVIANAINSQYGTLFTKSSQHTTIKPVIAKQVVPP